jgi:hypothetical protein
VVLNYSVAGTILHCPTYNEKMLNFLNKLKKRMGDRRVSHFPPYVFRFATFPPLVFFSVFVSIRVVLLSTRMLVVLNLH